jgi:hypothetical protein
MSQPMCETAIFRICQKRYIASARLLSVPTHGEEANKFVVPEKLRIGVARIQLAEDRVLYKHGNDPLGCIKGEEFL